ncbi:hypothetical protein GQR58_024885 [Nymphon striatum]|nr:hypothetical protein GQR58_024885 [Nymphon striatum]
MFSLQNINFSTRGAGSKGGSGDSFVPFIKKGKIELGRQRQESGNSRPRKKNKNLFFSPGLEYYLDQFSTLSWQNHEPAKATNQQIPFVGYHAHCVGKTETGQEHRDTVNGIPASEPLYTLKQVQNQCLIPFDHFLRQFTGQNLYYPYLEIKNVSNIVSANTMDNLDHKSNSTSTVKLKSQCVRGFLSKIKIHYEGACGHGSKPSERSNLKFIRLNTTGHFTMIAKASSFLFSIRCCYLKNQIEQAIKSDDKDKLTSKPKHIISSIIEKEIVPVLPALSVEKHTCACDGSTLDLINTPQTEAEPFRLSCKAKKKKKRKTEVRRQEFLRWKKSNNIFFWFPSDSFSYRITCRMWFMCSFSAAYLKIKGRKLMQVGYFAKISDIRRAETTIRKSASSLAWCTSDPAIYSLIYEPYLEKCALAKVLVRSVKTWAPTNTQFDVISADVSVKEFLRQLADRRRKYLRHVNENQQKLAIPPLKGIPNSVREYEIEREREKEKRKRKNSNNGTDKNCTDPFNSAYSVYEQMCMVPRKNHVGGAFQFHQLIVILNQHDQNCQSSIKTALRLCLLNKPALSGYPQHQVLQTLELNLDHLEEHLRNGRWQYTYTADKYKKTMQLHGDMVANEVYRVEETSCNFRVSSEGQSGQKKMMNLICYFPLRIIIATNDKYFSMQKLNFWEEFGQIKQKDIQPENQQTAIATQLHRKGICYLNSAVKFLVPTLV